MKDKVVIVTGASSGIGRACAYEFAKLGSHVVLAARSMDKLLKIQKEIQATGVECLPVKTDVTIKEDCEFLIQETIKNFNKIDILVNNAGISMRATTEDCEIHVIEKLMKVNFWGTVYCTKAALPHLLKSHGSVVAVSSLAGILGLPGRCGYSASKFAIHGFMESLRIENLKNGLHVMLVTAGFTSTDIRKRALTADGSPQGYTPRKENSMMTPEQVAKKIINGLLKKKKYNIITVEGKLLYYLKAFIPGITEKSVYRVFAKEPTSPFN